VTLAPVNNSEWTAVGDAARKTLLGAAKSALDFDQNGATIKA
jgi:hypothetical protein